MRRDSPAARMTAASGLRSATAADISGSVVVKTGCLREFDGFVRQIPRVAAHGDQFRRDAHRNFFRRESTNVEPYGRVHALELRRGVAFAHESLVNGNHLALAANHADVARF